MKNMKFMNDCMDAGGRATHGAVAEKNGGKNFVSFWFINHKRNYSPYLMPASVMFKASFAYMDVGKGREHDCMDAGGRATQEQLPRSGSFELR